MNQTAINSSSVAVSNHSRTVTPLSRALGIVLGLLAGYGVVAAQDVEVPGGTAPLLRVSSTGELSQITSLAVSPNGRTLYAGGWDKIVHVWTQQNGEFVYDADAAYRIPVGGGLDGGINAIALSEDGRWLAIGGRGAKRGVAGQRDYGYLLPGGSLNPEKWEDEGQIYVFDTQTRQAKSLRGHRGAVVTLQFGPHAEGTGPVLFSVASTRDDGSEGSEIIAWEVENERAIAQVDDYTVAANGATNNVPLPPVNVSFPPRMAAWRTEPGGGELRVALTWGTPGFGARIWDLTQNRLSLPDPNDPLFYFMVAAHAPGSFYTSGGNTRTGEIEFGLWTPRPDARAPGPRQVNYQIQRRFPNHQYPTLAAKFQSTNDYVALVVSDMQQQAAQLMVLNGDGSRVVAEHELWTGLFVPSLVAAQQGDTLAVARAGSNEILVYDQQELLQADAEPRRIRLDLPEFASVRFVRNGERDGIRLESPDVGTRIFDLDERELTGAPEGWQDASLSPGDWTVGVTDSSPGAMTLEVSRAGNQVSEVSIVSRVSTNSVPELTSAVVSPAHDRLDRPMLVCALLTNLQPELHVYDLTTGEQVRQLTAHTGMIRDLAVSDDQRLLASISSDHTLRVWRLSDLAVQMDRHGLIRNGNRLLEVSDSDGRLTVSGDDGGLPDGTEIRAILSAQEERPLSDVFELYEYAHLRSPGEIIRLRTSAGDRDIVLGRAIDDRKPLFSLFLIRSATDEGEDWIGWNPLGPYESSSRDAERHIGWHFNTGDPSAPARFASANEYRDAYYTPRVLKFLFENEELPDRQLHDPPQMSILIRNPQGQFLPVDYAGQMLVREPSAEALLQLAGSFPRPLIGDVSCELETNGGDPVRTSAERAGESDWSVPLSAFEWSSGHYRLRMKVVTKEFPARTFEETVSLRFQPPAPQLQVEPVEPGQEPGVDVTFRVSVAPGATARALLRHYDEEGTLLSTNNWDPFSGDRTITQPLSLEEGYNRIVVTAANDNRIYGFEMLESSTQTFDVEWGRQEPPAPPQIRLSWLEDSSRREFPLDPVRETDPATDATGEVGATQTTPDLAPVELEVPEVTLFGSVQSEQNLQFVRIYVEDQQADITIPERSPEQFDFEHALTIPPGSHVLRVVALTESGERAQRQLTLNYRPLLPLLTDVRVQAVRRPDPALDPTSLPDTGQTDLTLFDQLHLPEVQFSTRLGVETDDVDAFEMSVLRNGQRLDVEVAIEDGIASALVPIEAGGNSLQFQITNEWDRVRDSDVVGVSLKRPPRIVGSISGPDEVGEEGIQSLTMTVSTANDLPLVGERTRLLVNGSVVPVEAELERRNDGTIEVSLARIPLDREGLNEVRIDVANDDGYNLVPVVHPVTMRVRPKPKAEITVLGPDSQSVVRDVELSFSIVSESDVRTVQVDRMVASTAETVGVFHPGEDGTIIVEEEADGVLKMVLPLQLEKGRNEFVITALNDGGESRVSHSVSYTYMPLRVHIETLGESLAPVRKDEQMTFSQSIATATAELTGYVEWNELPQEPDGAQFWVNGFMQTYEELEPIEGFTNRRRFRVKLHFNQQQDNVVEVVIPDFAVDADSRKQMTFLVDCEDPGQQQKLYMVIIGALPLSRDGDFDQELYKAKLTTMSTEALQMRTERDGTRRISSPAFSEIERVFLTGRDTGISRLKSSLGAIRYRTLQEANQGANVVLMIYYHGKEARFERNGEEQFVLATASTWSDPSAQPGKSLKSEDLVEFVDECGGAHLLFLDVNSAPTSGESPWPTNPRLGIVRATWEESEWDASSPPLMTAMRDVMPQRPLLEQVVAGLEESFQAPKPLLADFKIPPLLRSLVVGGSESN